MDVEAAKVAYDVAVHAFDAAVEQSLAVCTRQCALEIAVKRGGMQLSDQSIQDTDRQLAACALAVRKAREARDAAAQALSTAGQPSLWERQVALVKRHHPTLFARYEHERADVAAATDDDAKDRKDRVLAKTAYDITTYRLPEVTA